MDSSALTPDLTNSAPPQSHSQGPVPMSRPPLEDFLTYLDGELKGDRLRRFEAYLARNREARRRLKQLARLQAKLADTLIVDSLVAEAKARKSHGTDAPIDETLIAAWIDGALTRDERQQLASRLADAASATQFYREAQTAKRATDRRERETSASSGDVPASAAAVPQPIPSTTTGATDWLGRLLIHAATDSATVLDAAPMRHDTVAVKRLEGGETAVALDFGALRLTVRVIPAFHSAQLELAAQGRSLPRQLILTDEAGRRMSQLDVVDGAAVTLPSLRPGVYRVMGPPTPLNLLLCINGELGSTEVGLLFNS